MKPAIYFPNLGVSADIVRLYPKLEKEDVYEAAKYGAWLASERTAALT